MDDDKSFLIEFQPLGLRDRFQPGRSLLDCARQAGIDLASICGGKGTCGKCRVQIVAGKVSEPLGEEEKSLSAEETEKGYCLACKTIPQSDLVLNLPPESLSAPQRLQVEGLITTLIPDPPVKGYDVSLPAPSLSDPRGDDERLFESLESQHGVPCRSIDQELSRSLPSLLRSLNWEASAVVRGDEIVHLARRGAPGYGMAVDLGTTKIAGYLVDLVSGQTLAARGMMNPQISYGEDIVSRLAHAARVPEGGSTLQKKLLETLNTLAEGLCREAAASPGPEEIREIVVVGNTAMHHLLLRLPVEQLARAPYVPAVSRARGLKTRDLGLSAAPGAYIYLPPNVAGYVGGDHLAMLAAINAWDAGGPLLAIDIGTNTEISLVVRGEISSVSCASGPAFEGAHISCGMRAAPGAIDQLRVSGEQVEFHTIHGSAPAGVCGSGIIDTLAQLFLNGIVDETGRIRRNHPRVLDNPERREFTIVRGEERGGGPAITLTQDDVRELQLAKAAIRTGIQILLKERGLSHEHVHEVVVAGAFGSYLDISSTIAIGMLPPLPLGRFRQVGNAAGAGARALLISKKERETVQEYARRIHYVELARVPDFQSTFVDALSLGWEKG